MEVLVGEHALSEWREGDAPHSFALQRVEQAALDPSVEHRIGGLVYQQWRPKLAEDPRGLLRTARRVRGNTGVERLALAYCGIERPERLRQRRVWVRAMRIEDVHVVQPHPMQTL